MIRQFAAVLLGLFFLGSPGAGETEPAKGPPYWEGKRRGELVEALGPPTKTKRDGRGGAVLIYRLRILGNELVGAGGLRWSQLGIGPSPLPLSGERSQDLHTPGIPEWGDIGVNEGALEVVATQKLRFHVNEDGIVYREEISPVKWKSRGKP